MVLIFPEGTRTHDGEIAPFRPVLRPWPSAPVRPSCRWPLKGPTRPFPAGRSPRLGRIRVYYGVPMMPAEFVGRDERDLVAEVERRVRECQAKLRQEV